MKRISLAVLLAVLMIVAVLPAAVFADDGPTCNPHSYPDTAESNNNGTHTFTCTVCTEEAEGHTKTEECNTLGKNGACSKCGYQSLNWDALGTALKKYGKYEKDKYTQASWETYSDALTAANEAYSALSCTTQDAINDLKNNLVDAADALEKAGPAEYAEVDRAQISAAQLVRADYTADSWANLQAALADVKYGLNVDHQAEVDAMAEKINNAIGALQPAVAAQFGNSANVTIEKAFESAKNGDTITLSADATLGSANLIIDKNVTLDLAGFTLNLNQHHIEVNKGVTFTLRDSSSKESGKITNGYAKDFGGGVYVTGTFDMYGGAITNCTAAKRGGGVYVRGTFNMYDGSIENCKATKDGGGGVWINNVKGTVFNMYDGSITGCEAPTGGGVYVYNTNVEFNMFGGDITNCKATKNGGGVYVITNGVFTVGGPSVVKNNLNGTNAADDAYADGKMKIAVGKYAPVKGMLVGLKNTNAKVENAANNDAAYFFSNVEGLEPTYANGVITLSEHTHEHTFGKWEKFDKNKHVRTCTCEGCTFAEYSEHTYGEAKFDWFFPASGDVKVTYSARCTECGYAAILAETTDIERNDVEGDSSHERLVAYVTIGDDTYFSTKYVVKEYTVDFAGGSIAYNNVNTKDTCKVPFSATVVLSPSAAGRYDFYVNGILSAVNAKTLTMKITENSTVTVVEHKEDKEVPHVQMTTDRYMENDVMKNSVRVDWAVQTSTGFTVKEAGFYFIYSKDGTKYTTAESIVKAGSARTSSLKCRNGYYSTTFSCRMTSSCYNKPLYTVGYVVYTDKSGNTNTVYSEVNFCDKLNFKK